MMTEITIIASMRKHFIPNIFKEVKSNFYNMMQICKTVIRAIYIDNAYYAPLPPPPQPPLL